MLLLGACAPKAECGDQAFYSRESYAEFITIQQNRIDSAMLRLSNAYEIGSEKNIRNRYRELISVCDSVRLLSERLSPYESDTTLKKSAFELFKFYNKIFHTEYLTLLNIYLNEELPGEKEKAQAMEVLKRVGAVEDSLKINLEKVKSDFVHNNASGQ